MIDLYLGDVDNGMPDACSGVMEYYEEAHGKSRMGMWPLKTKPTFNLIRGRAKYANWTGTSKKCKYEAKVVAGGKIEFIAVNLYKKTLYRYCLNKENVELYSSENQHFYVSPNFLSHGNRKLNNTLK